MKLWHYEIVFVQRSVEVIVVREGRMPLRSVVERGVVCAGPTGMLKLHGTEEGLTPIEFRLRSEKGLSDPMHGLIVYEREKDAVDFLTQRFVPSPESPLAEVLAGDDEEEVKREQVRSMLGEGTRVWLHTSRGRRPRLDFIIPRHEFDDMAVLRLPAVRHVYHRSSELILLASEKTIDYAGHRIPRRALVAVIRRGLCSWFNGVNRGMAPSLKEIPRALLDELDAEGRPLGQGFAEPFPSAPMESLFLLRVPSRTEADSSGLAGAAAPRLEEPLYIVDTREPVELPPGLPVLNDPAEAISIMARVSDGMYVPGDIENPSVALEDAPRWCVAQRVPV